MGAHAHQFFDPFQGLTDTDGSEFWNSVRPHLHRQGFGAKPLTTTGFTGNQLEILLELLTLGFTAGIAELPLEDYEARRVRLILAGDPMAVGDAGRRADYLKANSGVLLLRVHRWTLALLRRMLARGGRTRELRRRAITQLSAAAKDQKSLALATLVMKMARDPFAKVKGMISEVPLGQ